MWMHFLFLKVKNKTKKTWYNLTFWTSSHRSNSFEWRSIDLDVFSDNQYKLGFFFSYQGIESLNKPLILLSVILRLKSALSGNLYGYKKTNILNNGSNQVNKWQILPNSEIYIFLGHAAVDFEDIPKIS